MDTYRRSTFSLSLLFVFISIYLLHFQLSFDPTQSRILTLISPSQPNSDTSENITTQPLITPNNYIIRFLEYKRAEDHRRYLEANIQSEGWQWIERRNPATKYPTDFGLISIEDSVKEKLVEKIGKLVLVKDVNVDLSYRRGLLHEERGKVSAFVDGKKRPGKIFTSMSFEEGEGDNTTNSNSSSFFHQLGAPPLGAGISSYFHVWG